jgi:hypothetical protein
MLLTEFSMFENSSLLLTLNQLLSENAAALHTVDDVGMYWEKYASSSLSGYS